MKPALVAIDWGTTSFRAYRMAEDGTVLDRHASASGILSVADGAFERTLHAEIGPWLAEPLPIIASGMITSRQGWVETEYLPCPARLDDIAGGLRSVDLAGGQHIRFVPGLSDAGAMPDVMRGEETQLVGAADLLGDGVYVLPGTHSKWALVAGGRIERFATFMTGEVYAVMRSHSILGRLIEGEAADEDAFARGVAFGAAEDSGGLLHALFSARTRGLAAEIAPTGLAAYLSGLLIGAEIAGARALIADSVEDRGAPVLLGGAALVARYEAAFAHLDLPVRTGPEDCAARGLYKLARAGGLVGTAHGR